MNKIKTVDGFYLVLTTALNLKKIMKLELKHLAPYLPYNLRFEILDYKCDYVGEKFGICNGFYFIGDGVYYTFKQRDVAGKNNNNCKPILRPLLDLTKEIEHDGEKFIPTETYKGLNQLQEIYESEFINLQYARHNTVMFLFRHHFDVFGLIEKGLAININTINE